MFTAIKTFWAFWETFKLGLFLGARHYDYQTLWHLKLTNEAAASLNMALDRDQGYKTFLPLPLSSVHGGHYPPRQSSGEQIIFQCAFTRWHESIYGHSSISVYSIYSVHELQIQTQTLFRGTS